MKDIACRHCQKSNALEVEIHSQRHTRNFDGLREHALLTCYIMALSCCTTLLHNPCLPFCRLTAVLQLLKPLTRSEAIPSYVYIQHIYSPSRDQPTSTTNISGTYNRAFVYAPSPLSHFRPSTAFALPLPLNVNPTELPTVQHAFNWRITALLSSLNAMASPAVLPLCQATVRCKKLARCRR